MLFLGLPGLGELAEDTTHSSGIDVQHVDDPASIKKMMVQQPRLVNAMLVRVDTLVKVVEEHLRSQKCDICGKNN